MPPFKFPYPLLLQYKPDEGGKGEAGIIDNVSPTQRAKIAFLLSPSMSSSIIQSRGFSRLKKGKKGFFPTWGAAGGMV